MKPIKNLIRDRNIAYASYLWVAIIALWSALVGLDYSRSIDHSGDIALVLVLFIFVPPTLIAMVVAVMFTIKAPDQKLKILVVSTVVLVGFWLFRSTIIGFVYAALSLYFSWRWFFIERRRLLQHLL